MEADAKSMGQWPANGMPNPHRKPTIQIRPRRGLFQLDLLSIWQYRELLGYLIWRDTKVRYKQAIMGAGWAVFQPIFSMLLFTAIFSYVAKLPSDGLPYPLFAYAGMLPWNFIAQATSRSGTSLVGESHLISKIYFPRLIIPLAAASAPAVDLLCALLMMIPHMLGRIVFKEGAGCPSKVHRKPSTTPTTGFKLYSNRHFCGTTLTG